MPKHAYRNSFALLIAKMDIMKRGDLIANCTAVKETSVTENSSKSTPRNRAVKLKLIISGKQEIKSVKSQCYMSSYLKFVLISFKNP